MNADAFQTPLRAFKNRQEIEQAKVCGCYQCLGTCSPSEVKEWTDNNQTALCPHCSCDTLIADTSGIPLTKERLQSIRQFWFGKASNEGHNPQGSH